jgi:FKBP-type peptidyl-prolyl cis-trans isomerase SlyD
MNANATIGQGSVVSLVYTLTDNEGNVFEERTPDDPAQFILGQQQILPAIEAALLGKTVGFRVKMQLPPSQAYGEFDSSLVAEMPRDQFSPHLEITPGMKFSTVGPQGQSLVVRITDVHDDTVMVDGNHPMAGLDIVFDLRVTDVRDALAEELKTGVIQTMNRSQLH